MYRPLIHQKKKYQSMDSGDMCAAFVDGFHYIKLNRTGISIAQNTISKSKNMDSQRTQIRGPYMTAMKSA